MATISKRTNGWRAQVRRKGISRSATFHKKIDAQQWALKIETEIDSGKFDVPDMTFSELIDKYLKEVTIHKKGARHETLRLLRLCDMDIGSVKLINLSENDFIKWRDERLKTVSPASVLREWNTLSNLMNIAINEWKFLKVNHLKSVKKPKTPKERTRRYSDEEIERLVFVSGYDFSHLPLTVLSRAGAAMLFAIETAMRAGEICNATWDDYHADKRILHIPTSKNGHARNVPLSTQAIKIINHLALIRDDNDDRIFKLNAGSLDASFRTLKERANLHNADLHFHDTRREALSRLSKKVEVMTLAKISGHRDIKILLNTYYAPDMSEVANLLG